MSKEQSLRVVSKFMIFIFISMVRPAPSDSAEPFRIVAYVPNWIDLKSFAPTIRYDHITHINIAFENPVSSDGEISFNLRNKLLIDAAQKHGVKVLVSIAGGAVTQDADLRSRYEALLSADKRVMFAERLIDYVKEHRLDGLDVDIEGSMIDAQYGPFIEELAKVFRREDRLLTAALSKGHGGTSVPPSTMKQFDYVNIMAYDATGPWNPNEPGQHSSFAFAKENIEYWIERGLPKSRAVLGVPFYGYGFGEDFTRNGIGYAAILEKHPGAHRSDKTGNTVWYNGMSTMASKVEYAIDQQLGGIMIWSLNHDATDQRSLLGVIARTVSRSSAAKQK